MSQKNPEAFYFYFILEFLCVICVICGKKSLKDFIVQFISAVKLATCFPSRRIAYPVRPAPAWNDPGGDVKYQSSSGGPSLLLNARQAALSSGLIRSGAALGPSISASVTRLFNHSAGTATSAGSSFICMSGFLSAMSLTEAAPGDGFSAVPHCLFAVHATEPA
jgi:hypothetical protein